MVEEVANPMALVEVAARLSLPLAVVRVLLEELSKEGWVDIHTESSTADDLDIDTLLRVIDAVKHLKPSGPNGDTLPLQSPETQ